MSPGTNVTWTVPADATIISGQGTDEITVDFGDQSGEVTATSNDGCQNQTHVLLVEVEQPYVKAFSFVNFDDPATATLNSSTGTLTEVSNPAPNIVNGSAISGEYVRNSAEQYDVLAYDISNITNGSDYVNKDKKFFFDVYTTAPIGTQILLQLETSAATPSNYPTGRHSRYVATITENSNWQRLEFTLLDRPDGGASDTDIGAIILLFASNSFTGDTYFFDNLDSYSVDNGSGNNQAPTVSITNPTNGSTLTAGSNITITADASDADGTISQVEFFVDGNSIGTDNSAPYSISWTVASGTSSLTATATDDQNASTTSSVVAVTGQSAGNPTSVHVASIVTGTANAGKGKKYGTATIVIENDLGNPVAGATVNGTFWVLIQNLELGRLVPTAPSPFRRARLPMAVLPSTFVSIT